ncbi:MAG TPA: ABC transporter permease [Spirochaetia bacterium]|nr:ABC transporter permease [Spirochaetia bacterium]
MTVFRFALRRSFRSPLNILLLCVLPVGVVFIPPVEGTTLPLGIHFYGQVIMFASFLMVRSIVDDRASGVLTRVAVAPIGYLRYLTETLLAYGVLLVAQNAVVVVLGSTLYGDRFRLPVLQLLALVCFSFTSLSFCLAGFSLFGRKDAAYGAIATVIILLSMIGGFYWPIEFMPGFLQKAALFTPPYWLIRALVGLQTGDPPIRLVFSLIIMVLFAMAFLVVGSRRRLE